MNLAYESLCWTLEIPGLMYPLVHYASLVDKDLYVFVLGAVPKLGPLPVGQSSLVLCCHQPFSVTELEEIICMPPICFSSVCTSFKSIKVFRLIVSLVHVSSALYITLLSMQCVRSHLESYVKFVCFGSHEDCTSCLCSGW